MLSYFLLGNISISEAAQRALGRVPLDLVARHAVHEHGLITADEARANLEGMASCGAIVSRYRIDPTNPKSKTVLVRTRDGWTDTTITLERKR